MNAMKEGHMRQTPTGPAYVGRCGVNFGLSVSKHARVLTQSTRYSRCSPML